MHDKGQAGKHLSAGLTWHLVTQGRLCSIDVGKDSCLHSTLLMDGLQYTRTVLESDFGHAMCDVNYFESVAVTNPDQKVFLCLSDDSQQL